MKNNIRVLFPFVGDSLGGSHISAITLAQNLPKDRFEAIVGVHKEGSLTDYLKQLDVEWKLLPKVRLVGPAALPKQLATMVISIFPLRKFLHRNRIDIVHTNDQRMHLTWLLATKSALSKMVWHQRTLSNSRRTTVYSELADMIITISEYCKTSLPKAMSKRARIIQNPIGISTEEEALTCSKYKLRETLIPTEEYKVVCWVANWREQKRPSVFVEMARSVLDSGREKTLFAMFGEAREPVRTETLQLIQRLGLQEHVMVMGVKTPIEPWIAACDVLVATAVNEGLGRTLIEAMLAGNPVIATADGGHLEVIEHNVTGILVPPDDPKAMAEAVIDMINNPDKAERISVKAREYALKTYSVENHVDRIEKIYESILKDKK